MNVDKFVQLVIKQIKTGIKDSGEKITHAGLGIDFELIVNPLRGSDDKITVETSGVGQKISFEITLDAPDLTDMTPVLEN